MNSLTVTDNTGSPRPISYDLPIYAILTETLLLDRISIRRLYTKSLYEVSTRSFDTKSLYEDFIRIHCPQLVVLLATQLL